jgi:hypothetical protein
MIESSPFTANLSDIELSKKDYEVLIEGIKQTPFKKNRSYGFVPELVEESMLSAKLVFRTATTIPDINEDTQEIEPQERKRTDLIPFRVDFDKQLLEVFDNKQNTQKLVTRLSSLAGWGITIQSLSLDLDQLYDEIVQSPYPATITGLRIQDFSINDHTRGSYHTKIFENQEGERLLKEYPEKVSYLTAEFEIQDENTTVGFYQSGSIRFYSSSTKDEMLMKKIKNMIVNTRGEQ